MKNLDLVPFCAANDTILNFDAFGSHGTSMTRAGSITRDGFQPSASGRRGPGAYMWYATHKDCPYALSLAKAFFMQAAKRGEYKDDADQSGAVIWGQVNVPDTEVLNLETPALRQTIRSALEQHWSTITNQDASEREKLVSSVHEMLIRRVESVRKISIVLATVQPPKMPDQLAVYVGQPFAIIFRNLSCVKLDSNIERVPA